MPPTCHSEMGKWGKKYVICTPDGHYIPRSFPHVSPPELKGALEERGRVLLTSPSLP